NITAKNADVCGILVVNTTDSTISNVSSHNTWGNGIQLHTSSNCDITDCDSYNNGAGIYLKSSSNNNIINCDTYDNSRHGIYLYYASYNDIINCNIYDNQGTYSYGIYISCPSDNNLIHHNNFVNNAVENAYDECSNQWDDGSEGNYWSDYEGKYPGATNNGLVWDTPYAIPGGSNQDNFPLVDPIGPEDFTLIISVVGSGTTTPEAGITHSYLSGTVVDLEAFPDDGWEFAGWSGDITTGENPTTITMDSHQA
ncbi:unnamed protein product, partial [marine sediment metagenome]